MRVGIRRSSSERVMALSRESVAAALVGQLREAWNYGNCKRGQYYQGNAGNLVVLISFEIASNASGTISKPIYDRDHVRRPILLGGRAFTRVGRLVRL